MLTTGINFTNFKLKKKYPNLKRSLKLLLSEKNPIIQSLTNEYRNNFNIKKIKKYKKFLNYRIIGMGGSVLGAQAIYEFLKPNIKKNFIFVNNLQDKKKKVKENKFVNIIVSKSGNTIETIINANIHIKKNDQNIIITENNKNHLHLIAENLKSEIVHHNNFIGGRYSVLSEVGMLPAELMGLNINKFKQLNNLIKNKSFLNSLISNVSSLIYFHKKKKFNSIIINYDEKSVSLFNWYQQLVAESLGKKKKGLLPIISIMPRDNHSVMQLYLDGFQNNFFTLFYVNNNYSLRVNNNQTISSPNFLKNKNINEIMLAQKKATENVFKKKNIPFRSIMIKKRNENTLGELFCYFILETILIAKVLNLNPYDQPSVELIKNETRRLLILN